MPYSFKQLSSTVLLDEGKLGAMQLQKEGLIDGVARRALQLPLFMGTGPMEQDLQE